VSESAQSKGLRYLAEHRLTVLRVDRERAEAECRRGGAVYRLGYANGAWVLQLPGAHHLLAPVRALVRVREAA